MTIKQPVDREEMLELFTLEELLEMDDWTIADALEILESHGLRLPGFLERDVEVEDAE